MIVLIDNYDSFTYNLYQMLLEFDSDIRIFRNDKITVDEIKALKPDGVVLSPGPKTPFDAGICIELIQKLSSEIPILGVCLGHQAMAEAFGGKVVGSGEIFHGKADYIFHDRSSLFHGVLLPFAAGRYHSLIVEKTSFPKDLVILAETPSGVIMAMKHKDYPCYGVQFHPESILTPEGRQIIKNFMEKIC